MGNVYISHKQVKAIPMNRLEYNKLRGWELPSDENGSDEGYLVEYLDGGEPNHKDFTGYISWSPKEQFDKGYNSNGSYSFGDVLLLLEEGKRVARKGWNGKDMFVYLVPANKYLAVTDAAIEHYGAGQYVPYNAYFALKNPDDTVSTWVPSVNDCMAKDWYII